MPSLAAYFSKHPWDVAKRGPMMVLIADSLPAISADSGLAHYGYKEFNVGGLTAIAPMEMVKIDASFRDASNVYEGLPRDDKVIYLMSLLDANQWKLACSSGVGLSDLRGEQRLVYQSILPSTFSYENSVMGKDGSIVPKPDEPPVVSLTPSEESGIRLRFSQSIQLGVKMQNGGFSALSPQLADQKREKKPYLRRSDIATEDKTSLYGVQIRKVIDNSFKPSDLDYKSHNLDSAIPLGTHATVAELCHSVSDSSGLNIVADIRVANYPVGLFGPSVRAGDLLRGLALSVMGTFRKVGDAYVLTYDLEGIGAKRLKIETWKLEFERETRARVDEWKRAIRANGGARKIGYPAEGALSLNDAMTRFMASDYEVGGPQTMPASQLPPEWQSVLRAGAPQFQGSMRSDVAFPFGDVMWNFVLPDGRNLEPEGSAGYTMSLTRELSPEKDRRSKTIVKPIQLSAERSPALIFKTDDPSLTGKISELAQSHGFKEIWLQTWSADCLKSAVESAKSLTMPIRLVIRPWESPKGVRLVDVDRNILGESSAQAEDRVENTATWQDLSVSWGIPPFAPGVLLGIDEPVRSTIWSSLTKLSATDGLDGVVLCDTEPRGYEPLTHAPLFGSCQFDLGYTTMLRSRFLAVQQVDPIDIVDRRIMAYDKLDLSLPYFGDPTEAVLDQPSDTLQKWAKLRADANEAAIRALVKQLPIPMYFQPRHIKQETITLDGVQAISWSGGVDLPAGTFDTAFEFESDSVPADGYFVWQFGYPKEPAQSSRMFDSLLRRLKNKRGLLAVDMSSVPPQEISTYLDKWFAKQ